MTEILSEIDIVEHKLEPIPEEDNEMVELPTQELSNDEKCCQESSSSSQNVETNTGDLQQNIESGKQVMLEHCYFKYLLDHDNSVQTSDYKQTNDYQEDTQLEIKQEFFELLEQQVDSNMEISDIVKGEAVASTSQNLTQFVDCGDTIKEEIKEEVEDEYQRDPLRLSNAVQSLDEPVTYEEFLYEA